ncbi:hypothetical protein VNI00_017479 [Paramarasmius palmivorus]|uniref:LITAF domain-containing protein n=1 Tax=Paramarasmius palmivorus TaxID=297713 RepID=A0AAW0B7P8_9AGAR
MILTATHGKTALPSLDDFKTLTDPGKVMILLPSSSKEKMVKSTRKRSGSERVNDRLPLAVEDPPPEYELEATQTQHEPQAGHVHHSQTPPTLPSPSQVGDEYLLSLFAKCAEGKHQRVTQYGCTGVIMAACLFPVGLDREVKCQRCGEVLKHKKRLSMRKGPKAIEGGEGHVEQVYAH